MRNDLHGRAKIVAAPFLADHTFVYPAGRKIAVAAGGRTHEALIMPEVQIRFRAIAGHENLAMLKRAHGAWIHVDVRIQLDHADGETARFENCAEASRGNSLAQ